MDSKTLKKYLNKITVGDCISYLQELPDECIDVCFADPPFNLKKKYSLYKDNLKEEEYLNWCEKWLIQLIRVTKKTGSIFIHNIPNWLIRYAEKLSGKPGIHFSKWIVWDAMSGANSTSLYPAHYGILYYVRDLKESKVFKIRYPHKRERTTTNLLKDWGGKKESLHPFGSLVTDVWTDIHRVMHNRFKDNHPCQLPIHLLQRVILMSSNESDIILDPFTGTGTTAIAAKSLGRKYIGFELEEKYSVIAENKLSQIEATSKIGSSWISYFNNEIQTIRDEDWNDLKDHFDIPKEKKQLEHSRIKLKDLSSYTNLTFPFYRT